MKRLSLLLGAVILLACSACGSAPKTLRAPCDDETVSVSENHAATLGEATIPCWGRLPVIGSDSVQWGAR